MLLAGGKFHKDATLYELNSKTSGTDMEMTWSFKQTNSRQGTAGPLTSTCWAYISYEVGSLSN